VSQVTENKEILCYIFKCLLLGGGYFLKITMIGTGNAFAKAYYNNNALVETDHMKLLIDCGITLPYALYQAGRSFDELDGVLISHIHADHIGGLEELAFQMMFKYRKKPVLYIAESLIEPLWSKSLQGGLTQGELDRIDCFFEVVPLQPNEDIQLAKDLTVRLIKTDHIPGKDSFSFVFNHHFFYSADMIFNPDLLLELEAAGVHTFYHDCQLESPGAVHASLEQLLTLPAELQRKIKLMHYGDTIGNYIGKTGEMTIVEQGKPSIIE